MSRRIKRVKDERGEGKEGEEGVREAGRGRLRAHPLCINTESLAACSAMRTRRGGKGMLGSDSFIHPRVRWFVYRLTATERNVRGTHEASLLLGRARQREE